MSPRTRGNRQGSVRKRGDLWYIRYVAPSGERVQRSTDAGSKREALERLAKEIDRVWGRAGTVKKTLVKDLLPLIEKDYAAKGQHVENVGYHWAHLSPVFGADTVDSLTTARLYSYVETRQREKAAASTIEQELACLRRMLRLGAAATPRLVDVVPVMPAIKVDNVRENFFDEDSFAMVHDELPEYLQPLATVAYWTGWRRGELLSLTWAQVDLERGRVRLRRGTTKNGEPRLIVLPAQALACLHDWHAKTIASGRITATVFHHNGKPIRDYYGAWRSACERAKVDGYRMHDFRRTAARALSRAGVPERVAMTITGHKTRSMFDRYNIVDERDLEAAAEAVSLGQALAKPGPKQSKKLRG